MKVYMSQINNKNHTMLMKRYIFIAVAVAGIFTSCKKDEPPTPSSSTTTLPTLTQGAGAIIINEGNFQSGNATVSYFKYSDASVIADLFQPANNRPLGDIGQSMKVINGKGYVVVNNSGKIEVVSMTDFKSTATISGLTSPRFMEAVTATKAYVTDLMSNSLTILNLQNNTVSGSVNIGHTSEAIAVVGSKAFVGGFGSDKLYVINTATDALEDSIAVAFGTNSMVVDGAGKLWVMCGGNYFTSAPGGLFRIDPTTNTVEQSFPMTTSDSPSKLSKNAAGDTLYYLNYSVYKMSTASAALPTSVFIDGSANSFYGLAVHPTSGEIYVTDAVDYVQQGKLLRYNAAGTLMNNVTVGIIPGYIHFY
ncbi:MAG: hypothetical protein Fur0041_16180 [Bacteroidia bacterium]